MKFLLLILIQIIVPAFSSLDADFKQVRHSSVFAQDQVSYGHLTYRHPDQIRWEYTSPQKKVWEIKGSQGNVPANVRQLISLIGQSISGEILKDNNSFDISISGKTATLRPKTRELKSMFDNIKLTFAATGVASQVVLTEKNGDTTTITFNNARYKTIQSNK